MKTKTPGATPKKTAFDKPLPGFRETPAEVAERELASAATPENEPKPRISVAINPDGTIDFSSMREATKAKFMAAVSSTPACLPSAAPGFTGASMFPAPVIVGMYNLLGTVEVMLAQSIGKIPAPIAHRVFTYTPDEINALTGPTSRVLAKYAGDWLLKYQDEIALATMLTSMHVMKFNAAMMLAKTMGPATVTPIRQEEKEEKDEIEGGKAPVAN